MKKLLTICLIMATLFSANAQEKKQLIGSWGLEKISFQNIETTDDDAHDEYAVLFKKALLKNGIKEGYKLKEEDKEFIGVAANQMASETFVSEIDFKENNKANKEYMLGELSGIYTIAANSLKIKWEGENELENIYEIKKLNLTDLIIEDNNLKITYYYKRSE